MHFFTTHTTTTYSNNEKTLCHSSFCVAAKSIFIFNFIEVESIFYINENASNFIVFCFLSFGRRKMFSSWSIGNEALLHVRKMKTFELSLVCLYVSYCSCNDVTLVITITTAIKMSGSVYILYSSSLTDGYNNWKCMFSCDEAENVGNFWTYFRFSALCMKGYMCTYLFWKINLRHFRL